MPTFLYLQGQFRVVCLFFSRYCRWQTVARYKWFSTSPFLFLLFLRRLRPQRTSHGQKWDGCRSNNKLGLKSVWNSTNELFLEVCEANKIKALSNTNNYFGFRPRLFSNFGVVSRHIYASQYPSFFSAPSWREGVGGGTHSKKMGKRGEGLPGGKNCYYSAREFLFAAPSLTPVLRLADSPSFSLDGSLE